VEAIREEERANGEISEFDEDIKDSGVLTCDTSGGYCWVAE